MYQKVFSMIADVQIIKKKFNFINSKYSVQWNRLN